MPPAWRRWPGGGPSRAAAGGAEVVRSGGLDVEAAAPVELAAARVVELFAEGAAPPMRIEVAREGEEPRLLLTSGAAGEVDAAAGVALHERVALARELVVGETTGKTHVARVLMKLDVRDRVQAVIVAYESGLVGS